MAHLRILATSDVHMHLSGYSEVSGAATPQKGLARLGRIIQTARQSALGAVLLLDNGDLLQGTPLSRSCVDHPDIALPALADFFEGLGYDAFGLGNHDFDFGLEHLEAVIEALPRPVLSANTFGVRGVLNRTLLDCTPAPGTHLRVGITSALPQQTALWTAHASAPAFEVTEPVEAVAQAVAALRDEDADLVVVLAHGGLEPVAYARGSEQFASAVQALEGVDAVIAGHSHQLVPSQGTVVRSRGTTPCVMPGYGAAHLGCIDLTLAKTETGWHVSESETCLKEVDGAEPLPELLDILKPIRELSAARLSTPLSTTDVHLHSYFAMIQANAGLGLVADAMLEGLARLPLPDDWRDLPRLAAVAPILSGGRAGPEQYFDIPAGPVNHAATEALFPFEDTLTARRVTGADLRLWLDRAAAIYADTSLGTGPSPLLHWQMPGFCFDMIRGLTVRIDPTRPARFAPDGTEIDPHATRLTRVDWNGAALRDTDTFVLGMSSYRAHGGGGYPVLGDPLPGPASDLHIQDLVTETFKRTQTLSSAPLDWALAPDLGVSATLDTSPEAEAHLDEIAHFEPENLGLTPDGFLRLRLLL